MDAGSIAGEDDAIKSDSEEAALWMASMQGDDSREDRVEVDIVEDSDSDSSIREDGLENKVGNNAGVIRERDERKGMEVRKGRQVQSGQLSELPELAADGRVGRENETAFVALISSRGIR